MKRKLKYMWHRLPEDKICVPELKKQIQEETGYPYTKIGEIFDIFLETIKRNVCEGKLVDIKGFGQFYALAQPEKIVNDFKNKPDLYGRTLGVKGQKVKGKKIQPAHWAFKFRSKEGIRERVKNLPPPTKEQIDNLYLD